MRIVASDPDGSAPLAGGSLWHIEKGDRVVENITILLADDHVLLRQGTRELLEREDDMTVFRVLLPRREETREETAAQAAE